jgi:hypothetical protein
MFFDFAISLRITSFGFSDIKSMNMDKKHGLFLRYEYFNAFISWYLNLKIRFET